MDPSDLFWCESCGFVRYLPNKTLHRGLCREHDAIMISVAMLLTRPVR